MRALVVSASGAHTAVTDGELDDITERVAAGFVSRGVGAGDVVVVRLPKG